MSLCQTNIIYYILWNWNLKESITMQLENDHKSKDLITPDGNVQQFVEFRES